MSNTEFQLRSGRGRVDSFTGLLATNGSAAVTGAKDTVGQQTSSVARTATGKITVTFPTYFKDVFSYAAQLHQGTPDGYGKIAQVDSFSAGSGPSTPATMVIGTYQFNPANGTSAHADTTAEITWSCQVRR